MRRSALAPERLEDDRSDIGEQVPTCHQSASVAPQLDFPGAQHIRDRRDACRYRLRGRPVFDEYYVRLCGGTAYERGRAVLSQDDRVTDLAVLYSGRGGLFGHLRHHL